MVLIFCAREKTTFLLKLNKQTKKFYGKNIIDTKKRLEQMPSALGTWKNSIQILTAIGQSISLPKNYSWTNKSIEISKFATLQQNYICTSSVTRLRLNGIKGMAYLHRSFRTIWAAADWRRRRFKADSLPKDSALYRNIIYRAIVLISSCICSDVRFQM